MADQAETDALVIGAGPTGLMAAEALAEAGRRVIVAEAKPSPARKLLMAGKSGLNLTRDEPFEPFLRHYDESADFLRKIVADFDACALMAWAEALGQPLFTGSTGRVFPKAMKASPLLRAWLARLARQGVVLHRNWRWTGWQGDAFAFGTPEGPQLLRPRVTVLALGGASWARLGSDGAWRAWLEGRGVTIRDFAPANAALAIHWSPHMQRHFGTPLKPLGLTAGHRTSRGEAVISRRGLEGGGIYPLTPALREGAPLVLDLKPDLAPETAAERLARPRGKASLSQHLRRTLGLTPAAIALLQECARPLPQEPAALAQMVKALPVPHNGPRPIDEAISTAGGIAWEALTPELELKALPGTFAAGEMIDWEAPTGGYLLTACLATGRHAGRAAARYAAST